MVGVGIVHVAADADGAFRCEALFPAFRTADVGEDASGVRKDGVGDDLFEIGVFFGQRAFHEARSGRGEECLEVAVDLKVESLETAEGI